MGLSEGRKSVRIGLAVLIQYRSVTDTQPATQPPSHVAVAITLNAQASSLKTVQTASKSTHKPWQSTSSNYVTLEQTAPRPRSVTKIHRNIKIKNTTFSYLQPARAVRYPHTLHGDRGRQDHYKNTKVSITFRSNAQFFLQGALKNLG